MTSYKKSLIFVSISLSLFSIARLVILVLYFQVFNELSVFEIAKGMIEGLRFDLASTIVFLSIPLILMNLPGKFIQNKPVQKLFAWIIFLELIVGIGFLIGDVIYFDYVKRHIAFELLLMGGEDTLVLSEMLFSVFLPHFIVFIVISVFLGIVWYKLATIPIKPSKLQLRTLAVYLVFFLGLIIAGRGGLGYKPITIIDAFASGNSAYSNLVMNGIFSVSHSSLIANDVKHHFFTESEALEILKHTPIQARYPFQLHHTGNPSKKLNLVFVLIESLSYKYVDSFANNNLGITKNLDLLAKQGIIATNFYAAGQRSVEGLQATLTGIPSIIGLPTIGIGLLANYSKLGTIADQNGYSTIFVQSLKRRSFRTDAIAGSVGFKQYYGMEDMPILLDYPDPNAAKYGWDYETYLFTLEKINQSKTPFLAYIVTSTTHTPYPRLPKHLEKYPHDPNLENGFLNTVNYTDWSIGEFMKKARTFDWFDDTIFIFTADHALAHYQAGTFLDKFKIPLIIYAPKIITPQVIQDVTSQLDLFKTIIQLLDFNTTFSSFGRSILEPSDDAFALVRDGSLMGIISNKGYLRHSLRNRLETDTFEKPVDESYFDELENKLLASDQLVYELLQSNRWSE